MSDEWKETAEQLFEGLKEGAKELFEEMRREEEEFLRRIAVDMAKQKLLSAKARVQGDEEQAKIHEDNIRFLKATAQAEMLRVALKIKNEAKSSLLAIIRAVGEVLIKLK